jgi:hypothetical protein
MSVQRKPDYVAPVAKAIAELIAARPASPTVEELCDHLRHSYLAAMRSDEQRRVPFEICIALVESLVPNHANGIHSLINSRMRSPTVQEVRDVLCPPRPEVPAIYLWQGKQVSREEQRRLHEEARRLAVDQHVEECACARCLKDLETAYLRSAAYYVRHLERSDPDLGGDEGELWVMARYMAGVANPYGSPGGWWNDPQSTVSLLKGVLAPLSRPSPAGGDHLG